MDILSLLEMYRNTPNANANVANGLVPQPKSGGINSWFNRASGDGTLDILAYTADQIGSRLAPNNVFAGMGSGMAQNRVMQRARKPLEDKGKMMENLLLESLLGKTEMTPRGTKGLSSISFAPGMNGGLPEYTVKGNFSGFGPRRNVPFDEGSPVKEQPEESLYRADDNLSWKENMERRSRQQSLEDMLAGVMSTQESDPASIILSPDQQKMLASERMMQKQDLYKLVGLLGDEQQKREQNAFRAVQFKMAQEAALKKREIEENKERRSEALFKLTEKGKSLDIDEKRWNAAQRGIKAAKALQEYKNSVTAGANSELMRQIHAVNLKTLQDPEVQAAVKDKKLMDVVIAKTKHDELLGRIDARSKVAGTKTEKEHTEEQRKLMETWNPAEISKSPYEAHKANMYGAYPIIFAGEGVGTNKAKAIPQTFAMTDPKMSFIDSADKLYAYALQKTGKKRLSMKQFEDFVTELRDKKVLTLKDYAPDNHWYDFLIPDKSTEEKSSFEQEADNAYPFAYVDNSDDDDVNLYDGEDEPGSIRGRY